MSAEPLHLLLGGEPGGRLASCGDVRARQKGYVKDCLEVSHQQLHHQGLVWVVYQGGQGHLGICLSWLDQCGAKDNAQVTRSHLVLLCLLSHSVVVKSDCEFHSYTDTLQVLFN